MYHESSRWQIDQYVNKITNTLAKGGSNRSRKLSIMIDYMPPLIWDRMFFSHNNTIYNDGQLRIACQMKADGEKSYSTFNADGNLPKSFTSEKFGDLDNCTIQNGLRHEYDMYNANMSYESRYGKFKFKSDIAARHNKYSHWLPLNPTTDLMPGPEPMPSEIQ